MSKAAAPFDLEVLRRPSLVRSLIWMAALLGLIALITAGGVLTYFFQHSILNRTDASLDEQIDDLYAGVTVEQGEVIAPALTDQAALRVYSGHYWEIAEANGRGGLKILVTSRSLFDGELKPPPDGTARLTPGARLYYNSAGPNKEPLRVGARRG